MGHALLQGRMILLPAEVHPAEQTDGSTSRTVLGRIGVAVERTVLVLHVVKELDRLLDHQRIDLEVGHVAALEGHELPAHGRRVAGLLGRVPPAAAARILGVHDVIQRQLRRHLEPRVLRHRIALGEGNAGKTLRIEAALDVALALLLDRQGCEVGDPLFDLGLVRAFAVREAAAQKRQQGQRRGAAAIQCVGALSAVRTLPLATGALLEIEVPAAVRHLVDRDPLECPIDGLFGIRTAATDGCHLRGVGSATEAATGAADHAHRRCQVGSGSCLGAEVGELDGERRGLDGVGSGYHLHIGHDCVGRGHDDVIGLRGIADRLVDLLLGELLELLDGFGGGGDDFPRLLLLRSRRDHERHRQQGHDVHEHAGAAGDQLIHAATAAFGRYGRLVAGSSRFRRGNCRNRLGRGRGLRGDRRLRRSSGLGRRGGWLRGRRRLGGRSSRLWCRLLLRIGIDLARHDVTPRANIARLAAGQALISVHSAERPVNLHNTIQFRGRR